MVHQIEDTIHSRTWLSLGLARKLLNINEATLRQWADNGLIRTFRTPGGHRRFSSDDIRALFENTEGGNPRPLPTNQVVLPRIRRKLSTSAPHDTNWMSRFDDAAQEEMRFLGRELLDLCLTSLGHPRLADVLAKARSLGSRYVAVSDSQGIALPETVQAFIFFRGLMVEALKPALVKHCGNNTHELSRCWQQLNRITDEVLLTVTQAFSAPTTQNNLDGRPHGG